MSQGIVSLALAAADRALISGTTDSASPHEYLATSGLSISESHDQQRSGAKKWRKKLRYPVKEGGRRTEGQIATAL